MAEGGICVAREAIKRTWSQQESYLQVDVVVGRLYENGIIGKMKRGQIFAEREPLARRRLLLQELEGKTTENILTYCDILEWSCEEEVIIRHGNIAKDIRAVVDELAPSVSTTSSMPELREFLREMSQHCEHPVEEPTSLITANPPNPLSSLYCVCSTRKQPVGFLTKKACRLLKSRLFQVRLTDCALARVFVERILASGLPCDVKIVSVEVGMAGLSSSASLLKKAIKMCNETDCENQDTLKCRLYGRLALCYQPHTQQKNECIRRAAQLSQSIVPDASCARAMAFLAEIMYDDQMDNMTEDVLLEAVDNADLAMDYLAQLPPHDQAQLEGVKLYKALVDAAGANFYSRNGNKSARTWALRAAKNSIGDIKLHRLSARGKAYYYYVCFVYQMALKSWSSARDFAKQSIALYLDNCNNMHDHAMRIALLTQDKDLIEWVEAKKNAHQMDEKMNPRHQRDLSSIQQLSVDSDDIVSLE